MALQKQLAIRYIRTKFKLLSAISKKRAAEQAFALFCTPQHRNTKALPSMFEKAEKIRFPFLDYTIQGYRWNKGQEKKVLILHGFESSVVNFDHYVKHLLKKGYEVLAFDAPAHGRSTGKLFNALLYKEFIEIIYKNYGPVHSFLAHSLGGLALSLALEDIKHDDSYKVVLIAPATETTTAVSTFFSYLKLDPALRPEFDKVIFEKGGHTTDWFSVTRAAKHIKAKVLWVHDKEDNLTPFADIRKVMQAHFPNFRFMITEGLGHRRIYHDSNVVKAIIDFL